MGTYFPILADAKSLAATLPPTLVSNFLAVPDDVSLTALVLQASIDIDNAMPYQGRRFDLVAQTQEFPRVAQQPSNVPIPIGGAIPLGFLYGQEIWDLDPVTNLPVVPLRILTAVIYQADWIQGGGDKALDVQFGGLKSESMGTASKSYDRDNLATETGLCRRALKLVESYRILSGRIV